MKNLVLSMLAIASITAMNSCSSESDPINEVTGGDNVEIKINAGITATTKAVISETDGVLADDLRVYFFKPEDGATPTWTAGTQLYATLAKASGHAITFTNDNYTTEVKQYYSNISGENSYLAGCYLGDAKIDSGDDLTNGNISFTINGTQDIMATTGASGNKTTPFTPFSFTHLLSQINVSLNGSVSTSATYGKITKIEITNVPTHLKLTLSGDKPDLSASSSADGTIIIYNDNAGLSVNAADVKAGDAVMILTSDGTNTLGTAAFPLKLKLTNSESKEFNVDVIVEGGLQASTNHAISLTFSEKISAEATIGTWATGKTGSGDIKEE